VKLGFSPATSEIEQKIFGSSTETAVKQFQQKNGLPVTGAVDDLTARKLAGLVATLTPVGPAPSSAGGTPSTSNSVSGTLTFDNGLPAAGITARLYNIGFAGQEAKLAETNSDAQGKYLLSFTIAAGTVANLQLRIPDPSGREIPISATKYNAGASETLNLVVPSSVQPLQSEFQRLSADMDKSVGGVAKLAQAQETDSRQDLTLLNQSTNWDARILAMAATAAQVSTSTGLGQDTLYALFRLGLPTDPSLLATVSPDAVGAALSKASQAGLVSMNQQQIDAAKTAFQGFVSKTQLSMKTPGAVSTFSEILNTHVNDNNTQVTFSNVFFTGNTNDLWSRAAAAKIPAQTLDILKLQGKFLYLTFNNAALAAKLQTDFATPANLVQLADKDYHLSGTWQSVLTGLAGNGGDQALQNLIPAMYEGATTADRLAAYSGDLARKVRFSFPTQVVARMVEKGDIPLSSAAVQSVTSFLRAAAPLGYNLGRTPLNAFLKRNGQDLPGVSIDSLESLKTLHRLFQVTPSAESLTAAVRLGFTSARQIARYSEEEFTRKYEQAFPPGEARMVYGQAQTISSVTFNLFTNAKQLDNLPSVYGLSAPEGARQAAKSSIVQQFPTMANLFGNVDFCQCEECRSVLSPAAYFVDALEFLGTSKANGSGYTPLDVLVGKDKTVSGRRPDLAALPLTCENSNTAMPYIDIVNEILEYCIAHTSLDAGAAYDTGAATTADLTAEPQNILPGVYSSLLKQAVFPRSLPFDLWIETVRGFLNYFKTSLAKVLDVLRPVDNLELFSDAHGWPYYRAQILSESLGISPAEYGVLTVTDPGTGKPSVSNWFRLYGYADENTALKGKADPSNPIPALSSAGNLCQRLGITYQELAYLVKTGFFNPALHSILFQFERLAINMSDAFSYTNQPGYLPLSAQAKTDFENLLNGITQRYKNENAASTFDAKNWLTALLPAGFSAKVLVLATPDSGCNFATTTLQYADNATAATPLDFLKIQLFVRLWKKLGWPLDELDRAMQVFFPASLPAWTDPNFPAAFSSAWKTALVYLAHLDDLKNQLNPILGRIGLLPFWSDLPVNGENSLYARLFLTPSVLNNDRAFDDPTGQFPRPLSDLQPPALEAFAAHQSSVQGVLGVTAAEIAAIFADAGTAVSTVSLVVNGQNENVASFSLRNLSIGYRYSTLAKCLGLSVADLISLKAMSTDTPFPVLTGNSLGALQDDLLLNETLSFVQSVRVVEKSGFSVDDLKYLLRQQFDPVGPYRSDRNALLDILLAISGRLRQIQTQNAVPANPGSIPESLIDQTLSTLLPAGILKAIFALLTNSQSFEASEPSPAAIDPTLFAAETRLSFHFDTVTKIQTVAFQGLLTDAKKAELKQINASTTFSSLLDAVQQQAQSALKQNVGDLLGVWASLVEYEAVRMNVTTSVNGAPLTKLDPAVTLSSDQSAKLLWLGYRGVLTDEKKTALLVLNNSGDLGALLTDIQDQSKPAYTGLIGNILAMWVNTQTSVATQSGVNAADQIDPGKFAAALAQAEQAGTISAPVPEIQFTYSGQVQTLSCQGVLTDAMRVNLANLMPASTVLANLLQTVRNQASTLYQTLASNFVTVGATDLDRFSGPFVGLQITKQQVLVKAQLMSIFLPLLTRKLSRQLIVETLSGSLGSDPNLTEGLLTDAALLSNPVDPGKSLLDVFLGVGEQGVTASFYSTAKPTGAPQASGTAATTDTADPTNSHPGTASARFAGYLEVPADGPYRFFAWLGDKNATALLVLDPPDPTALLINPIIADTTAAAKDGDEISQFVELKGGIPYHFTLDFANLGANGASLLIQGESLPKGPLSQIVLYSDEAVTRFMRARVLLEKVLQILQKTGIGERELSYLMAHAAQFGDLRLSSLPTEESDDAQDKAQGLFRQFLALADYADLRKGPSGGSDGLIDVFANVNQVFTESVVAEDSNDNPATPWKSLANLTRRDASVVRDIARYFGLLAEVANATSRQVTATGDFGNSRGVRRIWRALQLHQLAGIPVNALTDSTVIASTAPPAVSPSPDLIAGSFKDAVKAKYTADSWRPVAQTVYDKLRQKKRDALVSYLVNTLGLENANQLFEYFLVDPGMEPVVQTSRLRLAMSSLQTFVQRCLLGLENGNAGQVERNVAPNAIDSSKWEWMKRYRVWEANREIFLFPENWMQPELRLDKTDLFGELESSLLQGDVTPELAEDAFRAYLKGLDVRARLDMVASYFDQDIAKPVNSTLHVLGRTYGHPHKYFYRTYSLGMWSNWQPMTIDIESDHIALAVWRGGVHAFWVTFVPQAQQQTSPASDADDSTPVSGMTFKDLATNVFSGAPQRLAVQVQLHRSEYSNGKWSNRVSTDVNTYDPVIAPSPFQASSIHIHVSKEIDSNGNEGAVRIHLDFPPLRGLAANTIFPGKFAVEALMIGGANNFFTGRRTVVVAGSGGHAFRVANKNSAPDFGTQYWLSAPENVYVASGVGPTVYTGASSLEASFETNVASDNTGTPDVEPILQTVNRFAILPCGNPVTPSGFLDAREPLYAEAGSLVSPFFYKDTGNPGVASDQQFSDELTFFVEPTLTETTIDQWEGWAVPPPRPPAEWADANLLSQIPIAAQVPVPGSAPVNPGDPILSIYPVKQTTDWLTGATTAVSFGKTYIGKTGGINPHVIATLAASGPGANAGTGVVKLPPSVLTAVAGVNLVGSQGIHLNRIKIQIANNRVL